MKTLVGVNCLTMIDPKIYISHCNFWTRTMQQFPNDEFLFFTPERMSIDNMRNTAAKFALLHECDFLMFIDDDVMIEPHTFKSLYDANADIVMAFTYIRSFPFRPMFFKYQDKERTHLQLYDDYKDHIDSNGLIKVDAVGFSCVLINTQLLKEIEPPYFVTATNHTEDVYFCVRCQQEIKRPLQIFVDTKVPTGHLCDRHPVHMDNVEQLRTYHQSLLEKEFLPTSGDRYPNTIQTKLDALDEVEFGLRGN